MLKLRRPSPAMVVALIALFIALSGTAFAVGSKIVPHAKLADVALVANNAKKLGGQTAAQVAAAPGPASSVAALVVIKNATWSLPSGGQGDFTVTCDPGQKAVGGGWQDPEGWGHSWDSRPTADDSGWHTVVTVQSSAPATQTGTVWAVCLK
jgi:hypothetical protein